MAALSAIATVVGVGLQVAGTLIGASAQAKMADQQRDATVQAENARRQQAQLDANRRRRQAFREMLLQRSTATATATNQGAGQGSGLQGALAQASGTYNQNRQTVTAAETLGNRVFDANIAYANATAEGQKSMAMGSAISSLGGGLTSMAGTLGRLGGAAAA